VGSRTAVDILLFLIAPASASCWQALPSGVFIYLHQTVYKYGRSAFLCVGDAISLAYIRQRSSLTIRMRDSRDLNLTIHEIVETNPRRLVMRHERIKTNKTYYEGGEFLCLSSGSWRVSVIINLPKDCLKERERERERDINFLNCIMFIEEEKWGIGCMIFMYFLFK